MNKLTILISVFLLFFLSCKKSDPTPNDNTSAHIELLYGNYVNWNFSPFSNQSKIPMDTILRDTKLNVKVGEYDLIGYHGFEYDSSEFLLNIKTGLDEETISFGYKSTADHSPLESWSSKINEICEFGIVAGLDYKNTNTAIKGNGLIEFTTGDTIKTSYTSKYSGMSTVSTLIVQ